MRRGIRSDGWQWAERRARNTTGRARRHGTLLHYATGSAQVTIYYLLINKGSEGRFQINYYIVFCISGHCNVNKSETGRINKT